MSLVVRLGGLCVLGALLAYFALQLQPKESTSIQAPIRVAVSTTPLSAPLIIADQLKLFEKHGVYVDVIPVRGGNLCFDMLLNDEVDLATSSESVVVFNSFARQDFAILSSFVESTNDVKLLTMADSDIRNVNDLKDKKIGVVKGSSSEYFLYTYIILSGYSAIPFEHVYLSAAELPTALISKKVDVISVWEPYGYDLIHEYGRKISQLDTQGLYSLSFNLVSKHSQASQHLAENIQILHALSDAIDFIHREPEAAKSMVASYLHISNDEINAAWPDYSFRLSLNNALLSSLKTQAHWVIDSEFTDKSTIPDYRQLVDRRAFDTMTKLATEY